MYWYHQNFSLETDRFEPCNNFPDVYIASIYQHNLYLVNRNSDILLLLAPLPYLLLTIIPEEQKFQSYKKQAKTLFLSSSNYLTIISNIEVNRKSFI